MSNEDNPRVFLPPPLIFGGLLTLGLLLDSDPLRFGPALIPKLAGAPYRGADVGGRSSQRYASQAAPLSSTTTVDVRLFCISIPFFALGQIVRISGRAPATTRQSMQLGWIGDR